MEKLSQLDILLYAETTIKNNLGYYKENGLAYTCETNQKILKELEYDFSIIKDLITKEKENARQKILSDIYETKLEMETVLDNLMNDISYGSEVLAEHAYNLEELELDLRVVEESMHR